MDIFVFPATTAPHDGRLICGDLDFPCAVGRNGIYANKIEGDGVTPTGGFPLRRLLYRPDRLSRPKTGLEATVILAEDGWCDDPDDPAYNRPVPVAYPGHCETLWRHDHRYDLIIILGHNDDPVRKGQGSAVFLHVAGCLSDGSLAPTEG
ncbi:MAG: hypothetical protein HOJ02_02580, partial [Rhodospirillaceae bacterium]|nr:hypothetical protein [Rhodospirillaceae bacterium]